MTLHRRQFLTNTLGATAAAGLCGSPQVLMRTAAAAEQAGSERVLVVVQLSGGNDGLNTVVPFRDDEYYKRRPTLAVSRSKVLKVDDSVGFHPAMEGLARLLQAGQLAVLQGIGYKQPNRSHFESMDIWHTCLRKDQPRPTGWLGRTMDQMQDLQGDVAGIHLGAEKQPFALSAVKTRAPSIREIDEFQLRGAGKDVVAAVRRLSQASAPADPLLSFIQSNAASALDASDRVRSAVKQKASATVYPETDLAKKLKTVTQLINAGLHTRVYYVELAGFDTHSQQDGAHASLLRTFSGAVDAFLQDLQASGQLDRVLLMAFSEFGRRVQENASEGTDHGAAGPMFLAGGAVRGGVHGPHPSLTDLSEGDLKHHTDFRRVYATVVDRWFGLPGDAALAGTYKPLDVLS